MWCVQQTGQTVAVKCITKKNLAKSQNLLSKEIKILRVRVVRLYGMLILELLYYVFINLFFCVNLCFIRNE